MTGWFLGMATIAATGIACGGTSSDDTGRTEQGLSVRLSPMQSCMEVESYARLSAIEAMNKRLDAEIASYLKNGSSCSYGAEGDSAGSAPNSGGSPSPAPQEKGSDSASNASGTNNQVANVDEADFVKNDTKYIYVVANGNLRIIDAWPAAQAHEIAKVALDGTPKKLFVQGNRALVYSSLPAASSSSSQSPSYGGSQGECTYGYGCTFDGDGTRTQVTVYDITNKAAPSLVRTTTFSGSYIAARRIGDAVHTVVTSRPFTFSGVSYQPEGVDLCGTSTATTLQTQNVLAAYAALRAKNRNIIQTADLSSQLPTIEDTANGASTQLLQQCGGFYKTSQSDGASFTTVHSVDMVNGGPAVTSTVVSRPGAVYASGERLFMAVPHERSDEGGGWYGGMEAVKQATTIHAFNIGQAPSATSYASSGIVEGAVLNQFSMDEYQGHLRVATTTGHAPDPTASSTLSVLEPHGQYMDVVGKVDKIAPSEDIRSVRFDDDKGYIVTFKKTDPLYVFDLANAHAPAKLAELKIPGFSTYMHMMDATHLLTIGYDADDQGSFAWFAGVRLQIFDVTVPTNPVLKHTEVIGTRGSSSEALTNHLAFNYYAPKGILALPMTVCEGGSGGSYGTNMTFSGLMVFNADVTNGFSLRGKVSHPTTNSQQGGYSSACSNWWTNASSEVKRSVVMDDVVFSISESLIKANALSNLPADISSVSLK
ncbi:MAG: putative lipoprotein [Myxococcaceae bacterium]|nr:putative lipoprotein [Myxococcaceae bacterium]